MFKKSSKKSLRDKKHKRIRRKVAGTSTAPRLCVYKSLSHIYAQIIDDSKGITMVSASTLEADLKDLPSRTNAAAAKEVGAAIARKAREKGITTVVFDRNGFKYHGGLAALADAAREGGLEF
ncbi:MAG: 50S ribosomal protein L18 [Syntrophomonas sp.]|nr:50S ribosomal protein L18 [Syntrophomonas sp.]